MSRLTKHIAAINTVGSIGYMLLVATWAFFMAIIIGLVFEASNRLNADIPMQPAVAPPSAEPSMIVTVVGYVLAVVALLVTIAILATLPYLIGKWGSRMVRRLMVITRIDITLTQLFLVKALLATMPLTALIIINVVYMPESVTFAAMYVATVALAAFTIGLFFVQLLLARRLKVSVDETW
jgi:hypothetical protein